MGTGIRAKQFKNIQCSICNSSHELTNQRTCPICGYAFLSFERNPKKIKRDMRDYRMQTGFQKEILRVGDTFEMGVYNGKNIVWRVLEVQEEQALVITEYIQKQAQFNWNMFSLTGTWDKCSLRRWLNSKWLFEIFNKRELERILPNRTVAYENPQYATPAGGEVEDQLFLLSIQEAEYFFKDKNERKAVLRISSAESTEEEMVDSWWWLRTPGDRRFFAADVEEDGSIFFEGDDISSAEGGVRPAMWLNLKGLEDIEELARPAEEPVAEESVPDQEAEEIETENAESASKKEEKTRASVKKPKFVLQELSLQVGMEYTIGKYAGEKIRWKVLDIEGGMALLLCEDGIDTMPFYDRWKAVCWEESHICNWLNDQFIKIAFSEKEQERIVYPEEVYQEDTLLLDNVMDTVFFLSMEEVKRYLRKGSDRIAPATRYAIQRGAKLSRVSDNCSWWLRDSGISASKAVRVRNNGRIDWRGIDVNSSEVCIRPAMRIWLE